MRTRSRSRSRNNSPQREASPAIVEPLRIELPFLEYELQEDPPPESTMADNRTMAELLQAPTEGYEDAIVIPEITANNFEHKHGLINLTLLPQIQAEIREEFRTGSGPLDSGGNPPPLLVLRRSRQRTSSRVFAEIREEFRTDSGPSGSGGNPPPVTIHTWLERFNKQKPRSFENVTALVDAENWISHMEKIFDVMGCFQQSRGPSEGYSYPVCTTCGRRHPVECRRAAGTCFKCGQTGHLQKDCKKNTAASTSGQADKKPGASGRVFAITEDHATKTSGRKVVIGIRRPLSRVVTGATSRGPSEGYTYPVCTTCGRKPGASGRVFAITEGHAANTSGTITGTLFIYGHAVFVLFDMGATHSVISSTFASRITTTPMLLDHVLCISTPMQDSVRITHVYRNLPLQFDDKIHAINALPLDMCEFDIILGMDWLTEHHATIDCRSYRVIFGDIHAPEFIYHGSLPRKYMQIISALQARTLSSHGCEGFLATIHDTTSEVPSIHDQPIVSEFLDVFPDELLGIPPVCEVKFNIDLIPEQRSGDRHQPTSQQSSHRSHGQNNDRHGSDKRGGSDNHRSSNNNYSGSNNRNFGNGRNQRNRSHQSNRSTNSGSQQSRGPSEGYSYPVCTTCGRRHQGECRRAAGTCFKCGQVGHLQKDCRKNTTTSTSGQADKKPGASGCVFAITEGQAANTS
nr:putative reverse transcriptase domain-containing protein [Tanacetum cinerariifolium]